MAKREGTENEKHLNPILAQRHIFQKKNRVAGIIQIKGDVGMKKNNENDRNSPEKIN